MDDAVSVPGAATVTVPATRVSHADDGAPRIGTAVGRYIVLAPLGAGGMGRVFRAYDPKLRREVAIKLLRAPDADAYTRIVREAQSMAQLQHPNVVAVFDVDSHGGNPFIAMEYIEGRSLAQWLTDERRRWSEVISMFAAAGAGLAAAHNAGIIHRDFKPANAMVGQSDRRVRVTDFGLARELVNEPEGSFAAIVDAADDDPTEPGAVLGTPSYMAPEQHDGKPADAASDQYAFCVSLWEALYGARPFRGDNIVAAKRALEFREPEDEAAVPAFVREAVVRGLAVDPADRFASMSDLLDALNRDPRHRRSVAILGALLLAGLGGWWGSFALERRESDAACDQEAARIDSAWNSDRSATLLEGFTRSGDPDPATTHGRIVPWLDRYVTQWQTMRRRACADAKLRGGSVAEHDRVADCLDARRAELDTLVGVLEDPSLAVAYDAVYSAAGLTPVSDCGALHRPSTPEETADREDVAAVRLALAEVSAMRTARSAEARRRATAALQQAQALAIPSIIAEAHYALALSAVAGGDPIAATEAATAAYFVAAPAGLDGRAARAATLLTFTVGETASDTSAGLIWGRLGRAHVERGGLQGTPIDAELRTNLGTVLTRTESFDEARAEFEHALRATETALGPQHPAVARCLNQFALLLESAGEDTEALAMHERALALKKAAYGPSHPHVAISIANIANIHYFAKDDVDTAVAMLREALAILEAAYGQEHPKIATVLNNLASMTFKAGDQETAVKLVLRATKIVTKVHGPEHPMMATHLLNLAGFRYAAGEYEEVRTLVERGLAIRRQTLGPKHLDVGVTLFRYASTLVKLQEPQDAVSAADEAVAIFTAHEGKTVAAAGLLEDLATELAETGARAHAVAQARRAADLYKGAPADVARIETWIRDLGPI